MYRELVMVSVGVSLLAGCVSQSKYQTLETRTAAERVSLEQEIATLRSQRQELEGQKAALERQLAALRDDVERRENELAAVNRQLSDLSTESTAQRSELESQKTTLERQIASLNERLADTERRAVDLAAQTAELATQKSELATQKEALVAQKDEEIRRLRGTYDSLVKDLESEIARGEIKVKQIRDRLSVQMVEKILFDSGKADIKPQGKAVLEKVGHVLSGVTDKQIRIEGYTDTVPIGAALRGKFPTNWELSTLRATTVLRFLQEKTGIDGKYLSAVGYGPHRPVADNDTEQGRAENRRIEIVLIPLDAPEVQSGMQ